jgi:hypothetical protein
MHFGAVSTHTMCEVGKATARSRLTMQRVVIAPMGSGHGSGEEGSGGLLERCHRAILNPTNEFSSPKGTHVGTVSPLPCPKRLSPARRRLLPWVGGSRSSAESHAAAPVAQASACLVPSEHGDVFTTPTLLFDLMLCHDSSLHLVQPFRSTRLTLTQSNVGSVRS